MRSVDAFCPKTPQSFVQIMGHSRLDRRRPPITYEGPVSPGYQRLAIATADNTRTKSAARAATNPKNP